MTTKSEVQGVVIALFGAYAGGYLAELTAEADAGNLDAMTTRLTSVQGIILGEDLSSDAVFADTVLANFGVTSDNAAYAAASGYFAQELAAGASRAAVVNAAVMFLNGIAAGTIVDSNYSAIAAAFAATVETGVLYSEGDGSVELSLVALQTAAGNAPVVVGQTFTLTTDTDVPAMTAGDDTITGASGTVGDGDILSDLTTTDNDTANLTLKADYTPSVIKNIETINLIWDAYATPTIDLDNVTGAQSINISSTKTGFLGSVNIDNAGANTIVGGSGMVATLDVDGATTGVVVQASSAKIVDVTGTGTATITAGASATTVNATGFKTATIDAGAATAITIDDSGSAAVTTVKTSASATLTNTNAAGDLSVEIAEAKTITLAAVLANTLTVTGSGATATVALGANSLDAAEIVNEKSAGTLTVSSSATTAADVSAVDADLIKLSGNVNGAFTVEDGQNLQFSRTAGTTLINLTGTSGDSTETVNVILSGSAQTAITATTLLAANITAAATAVSGADITIATLTTNAATITLDGTNDVTITAVADSGTDSGILDASALAGDLTISSIAADNDFTVLTGTGDASVTTAASYSGDLVVEAQDGDDELVAALTTGTVTALMADGDNVVTAATITSGTLVVTAGAGDDEVDLSGATLEDGTINLNLGDGANTVTLQAATTAAKKATVTVTTGAGDDLVELVAAGSGASTTADTYTITLGEGTDDTLYFSTEGETHEFDTLTLSGVEIIQVAAETDADADTSFSVSLKAAVLSGKTYTIQADGYSALTETDIEVVAASTTTAVDLSSLVVDQTLTGAISSFTIDGVTNAPTAAMTITGSSIADYVYGSAYADTIVAGKGGDTIDGNDGNDSVDLTEVTGSRSDDNVILDAAGDGVDTITGFKIGEDTITLGDAAEAATGGAAVLSTSSETVVAGALAFDLTDVLTEAVDVVEIAATLSSYGDLSQSTDGTELLKALSSTAVASTGLQIGDADDDAGGVFVVAYQSSKAYIYLVTPTDDSDVNGLDLVVDASGIQLVGVVNSVAGALTAAEFIAL